MALLTHPVLAEKFGTLDLKIIKKNRSCVAISGQNNAKLAEAPAGCSAEGQTQQQPDSDPA